LSSFDGQATFSFIHFHLSLYVCLYPMRYIISAYSYWRNNKFTQTINKQTNGKTTFKDVNTHGMVGLKSGSNKQGVRQWN